MAIVLTKTIESNDNKGELILVGSESVTQEAVGNSFVLPEGVGKISNWLIGVSNVVGTCKVQYSNSARSVIVAGGGNFSDWENGNVSAIATETTYQITSCRLVVLSGSATIEVRVA